jgi:antitoxin (DNA-binding transcriptional repressor) of toxin-antitoxin stability system
LCSLNTGQGEGIDKPDQTRLVCEFMKPLKVYTITEAKAQLSDILRRVRLGDRIAIGAARIPEVELRIFAPQVKTREFGKLRGRISMSEDFTAPDQEIERMFSGN